MQIIPVLDLLDGIVVRGVAGQRETYQPVRSCLTKTADAFEIAKAFRNQLGLNRLYVADLDAILHHKSNLEIITQLAKDGFEVFVDAGLRDIAMGSALFQAGANKVIAGLETIPAPQLLQSLCENFGAERIIFSLDLLADVPLGELSQWRESDPFAIGCEAVAMGITQLIVLDLSQVGVGAGIETLPLCTKLLKRFPQLNIITGGGVRTIDDIQTIATSGVHGLLIASALHHGAIGKTDIEQIN